MQDTALIIDNCGVEISGRNGYGPPILEEDRIHLNGLDDPHESFDLYKWDTHGCCKTARKPYDVVVTAVLLRAHMLYGGGTEIRSDGTWEEWGEGRYLVEQLFPSEEITPPWAHRDGERY